MKRQQTESKLTVRPAAVAGRFYPGDPDELRETIKSLLAEAETEPCGTAPPWAIIAPHAGYIYSGSIAASAYATWKGHAENIKRVVLIGPAHFADAEGILASSAGGFETPLGVVRVDTQAIGRLLERGW